MNSAELPDVTSSPLARLFLSEGRRDPYTPARELRATGAVHETPLGLRLLTRYADRATVLPDTVWSHADEAAQLHPTRSALPTRFRPMEWTAR